jgi:hypothetical protein
MSYLQLSHRHLVLAFRPRHHTSAAATVYASFGHRSIRNALATGAEIAPGHTHRQSVPKVTMHFVGRTMATICPCGLVGWLVGWYSFLDANRNIIHGDSICIWSVHAWPADGQIFCPKGFCLLTNSVGEQKMSEMYNPALADGSKTWWA